MTRVMLTLKRGGGVELHRGGREGGIGYDATVDYTKKAIKTTKDLMDGKKS